MKKKTRVFKRFPRQTLTLLFLVSSALVDASQIGSQCDDVTLDWKENSEKNSSGIKTFSTVTSQQQSVDYIDPFQTFYQMLHPKDQAHLGNLDISDQTQIPQNYSAAFLSLLLLNPNVFQNMESVKGCSYTIENNRIIFHPVQSILEPWIRKTAPNEHYLNNHHDFFYESWLETPLQQDVKERLKILAPDVFLLHWLGSVATKTLNKEQVQLFQQRLRKLHELCYNLAEITHRQLFKILNPLVYAYYWPNEEISQQNLTLSFEEVFHTFKITHDMITDEYGKRSPLFKKLRTITDQMPEQVTGLDAAITIMNGISFDQYTPEISEILFKTAARSFSWTTAPLEGFPKCWKERASQPLIFDVPDQGRLITFCHALGADFARNETDESYLHLAFTSFHNGTVANIHTLCGAGINVDTLNSSKQTVLDRVLQARLETSELQTQKYLDDIWSLLMVNGAGHRLNLNTAIALYYHLQLPSSKKLPEPYAMLFYMLSQINPTLAWEITKNKTFPLHQGSGTRLLKTVSIQRNFPEEIYNKLYRNDIFDPDQSNRKDPNGLGIGNGKRLVGFLPKERFCFKLNPEFPAIESAIHSFMQCLFGYPGTPCHEIMRFGSDVFLVSSFVEGRRLDDVLNKNPELLEKGALDDQRLGELILASILTNPEDGRPPNYILTTSDLDSRRSKIGSRAKLVCIDNDHSFASAISQDVKEGRANIKVQGNSVLFCLNQMNDPIYPALLNKLSILKLDEFLNEWLAELEKIEGGYRGLFEPGEIEHYRTNTSSINLTIPLTPVRLQYVYDKLHSLQKLLNSSKSIENSSGIAKDPETLTYFDILSELEPKLFSRYKSAFDKHRTIKGRLKETDNRLMSTVSSTIFLSVLNPSVDNTFYHMSDIRRMLYKLLQKEQEDFKTLAPQGQMWLFEGLSASTLSETKQQEWFELIARYSHEWTRFTAKGYSYLTDAYIRAMPLSNVISLNLENCSAITSDLFGMLGQYCPGLRIFQASNLSQISTISWGLFGGMKFNYLEILQLDNFPSFTTLRIDTPKLTHLLVTKCPSLTTLRTTSTRLAKIDIRGDAQLPAQQILALLKQQLKSPQKLLLEGCDEILEKEFLETYKNPDFYRSLLPVLNAQLRKAIIVAYTDPYETEMDLSNNQIDVIGITSLADALQVNTTILELNLAQNQIDNNGAKIIANLLKKNIPLEQLDLRDNQISDGGMIVLADALRKNTKLRTLIIGNNRISTTGIMAFVNALKENSTLQVLDFLDNQIRVEDFDAFMDIFVTNRINTTLRTLNIKIKEDTDWTKYRLGAVAGPVKQFTLVAALMANVNGKKDSSVATSNVETSASSSHISVKCDSDTEKNIWESIETESLTTVDHTEWRPTLFSLQGFHAPLLSYLTTFEEDHLRSYTQYNQIQNHVDTWAGSGKGGLLALALLKPSDLVYRTPISMTECASWWSNISTSVSVFSQFFGTTSLNQSWSLSEATHPITVSFMDMTSSAVKTYDHTTAVRQEEHDLSMADLAQQLLSNISTDPTVSGLNMLTREYPIERYPMATHPIIVSLGVSMNSRITHDEIHSQYTPSTYARPNLFSTSTQSEEDMDILARLLSENTARRQEATGVMPRASNVSHKVSSAKLMLNPTLTTAVIFSSSIPSFEEMMASERQRLATLNPETLISEYKRFQEKNRSLWNNEYQRKISDKEALITLNAMLTIHYTNLEQGHQQAFSMLTRAGEAALQARDIAIPKMTSSLETAKNQINIVQRMPAIQNVIKNPSMAKSFLESFYALKNNLFYSILKHEFEAAFLTCEALSLGRVDRLTTQSEQLAGVGASFCETIGGIVPMIGSTAGKMAGLLLTQSVALYQTIESNNRVNRVMNMYKHQGLDGISQVSQSWANVMAYQLQKPVQSLTSDSLTSLAATVVGRAIDFIADSESPLSLFDVLHELKQTTGFNNFRDKLRRLQSSIMLNEQLTRDDHSEPIVLATILGMLDRTKVPTIVMMTEFQTSNATKAQYAKDIMAQT